MTDIQVSALKQDSIEIKKHIQDIAKLGNTTLVTKLRRKLEIIEEKLECQ